MEDISISEVDKQTYKKKDYSNSDEEKGSKTYLVYTGLFAAVYILLTVTFVLTFNNEHKLSDVEQRLSALESHKEISARPYRIASNADIRNMKM